jgi:urea carboxylase
LHVDPDAVPIADLLCIVRAVDEALPPTRDLVVPSRTVRMPLCWDDPALRGAAAPVAQLRDGPSCPASLEFLRQLNGLGSVAEVRRIVFAAEYLVLGLGDGYPGGPVATPLDPRHRLVTTSFDPPRAATPTGAVTIGAGYLGISGPSGPHDGQLLGRTVPIWPTDSTGGREDACPSGLLRCFDRISWYDVDPSELSAMRAGADEQEASITITKGTFSMADYDHFLAENLEAIAEATHRQSSAFADHRMAWRRAGLLDRPGA